MNKKSAGQCTVRPIGRTARDQGRSIFVLLVSCDVAFCEAAFEHLREQSIHLVAVHSGEQGLMLTGKRHPDVVVIDESLPGLDGFSTLKIMREDVRELPVLFLTSDSNLERRVEALEAGADDSVGRPFALKEIGARIRVLARKYHPSADMGKRFVGEIEIDLINRIVSRQGKIINLQPREFDLLLYLANNAGRVLTRATLLENVWNIPFDPKTNLVETHISRLRAKIDQGFPTQVIRTIRGSGYIISG